MKIPVLDHGYVELIEFWGSDERIIEAARMSTAKGFLGWGPNPCPDCLETPGTVVSVVKAGWLGDNKGDPGIRVLQCPRCKGTAKVPGDEGLLSYLWLNRHHTPFEMAGMIIEVQAPILVYRQWHRHRTQSYNELSARYTELPDVFYVPSEERLTQSAQSSSNKQASGKGALTETPAALQQRIRETCEEAYVGYQYLLKAGVSKELARCVLPVNVYSRMRASAVLRNWLHFLDLRLDSHAQWEIRQYANVVGDLIKQQFPRTWELFAKEL